MNKKVTFIVDSKTSKAEAGFKRVDKQVNSMSKNFKQLGSIIGGAFAIQKVTSFLKDSIRLFGIQEIAVKKLDTALGRNTEELQDYASHLQSITTIGDEVIINVMAQIGMFVKSEESIKKLTKATLDMAAATGMDLNSAAQLVAKSLGSSTNALSRYGIVIEGAVGSTERLDTALKNMNEKFAGQAEAQLDTYTGKLENLSNALGDLMEGIGEATLKGLFAFLQGGASIQGVGLGYAIGQANEELAKIFQTIKELPDIGKLVPSELEDIMLSDVKISDYAIREAKYWKTISEKVKQAAWEVGHYGLKVNELNAKGTKSSKFFDKNKDPLEKVDEVFSKTQMTAISFDEAFTKSFLDSIDVMGSAFIGMFATVFDTGSRFLDSFLASMTTNFLGGLLKLLPGGGLVGGLISLFSADDALITKKGDIVKFNPNDNILAFQGAIPSGGGGVYYFDMGDTVVKAVEVSSSNLAKKRLRLRR